MRLVFVSVALPKHSGLCSAIYQKKKRKGKEQMDILKSKCHDQSTNQLNSLKNLRKKTKGFSYNENKWLSSVLIEKNERSNARLKKY